MQAVLDFRKRLHWPNISRYWKSWGKYQSGINSDPRTPEQHGLHKTPHHPIFIVSQPLLKCTAK